jgi:hypothetical protein
MQQARKPRDTKATDFHIRLSRDVAERIRKTAAEEGRLISAHIERLILKGLEAGK